MSSNMLLFDSLSLLLCNFVDEESLGILGLDITNFNYDLYCNLQMSSTLRKSCSSFCIATIVSIVSSLCMSSN